MPKTPAALVSFVPPSCRIPVSGCRVHGPAALVIVACIVTATLVLWRVRWPASFSRLIARPARLRRRALLPRRRPLVVLVL